MVILHLALSGRKFLLWAEKRADISEEPVRRRGRKPKRSRVEVHPFTADQTELLMVIREGGLDAVVVGEAKAVAWLPTLGGKPLPSSPLIAEAAVDGQPVLIPWQVPVVHLGNDVVLELLLTCRGKQTLAPGIIVGRDLGYWANCLGFPANLVAQGLFLPGIKVEQGVYRACWQPFLAGDLPEYLDLMAAAMPPACRALTESDQSPVVDAAPVLVEFLEEMVDRIVRSSIDKKTLRSLSYLRSVNKEKASFESIHDQWLYALGFSESILEEKTPVLEGFSRQIGEWKRRLAAVEEGPLRLCFRLDEPREPEELNNNGKTPQQGRKKQVAGDKWQVQFFLQSKRDPSLMIAATEIWNDHERWTALTGTGPGQVREYLLMALGRACGLCPEVEGSLRTSAPAGFELNSTGAYNFLSEQAIALEMAGFRVLLPAWWSRKGTAVRLKAKAKVKSPKLQAQGVLSLNAVTRFDWEVALGDQTLSQEDLQALAGLKTPLVKLRGQWVQLNATEIQAALEFWQKKNKNSFNVRDAIQLALGGGKTPGGMEFDGVEAEGWVGELLNRLEGRARYEEAAPPEGLQGTLRPYQIRGYSWLKFLRQFGLGACLADDMGLGKTIQTLALLQAIREAEQAQPALLICPTSLLGNWQKEAARFTPDLPVMVHHGPDRLSGSEWEEEARKQALVVSSYGLLQRDIDEFKRLDWSALILDEAQNIKNPVTRQAKAARSIQAEFKIALTGTPVENNVGDLWSIMEFLNPGLLGSQSEFKRNFFLPIQAAGNQEAADRLKKITAPFIMRRLKTDKSIIRDLPEKLEMKVYCNLTQEQASLYKAVVNEVDAALEGAAGIERKGLILSTLSKLKQVCNHPAHFLKDNSETGGRSGKLARLSEMLEEITANREKALIFTQFAEMGEILQRHLQDNLGWEIPFLHGAVPQQKRDRMVERFQSADADLPVFILSLKAGGTGLNLTRANHVFHFDRWWNPAVENQASDRAYRIGQTKNVQVHKFICAGTLEEKIDEMISRKQALAEQVVGTGEGWLTELSTTELKNLFALSKEAVG